MYKKEGKYQNMDFIRRTWAEIDLDALDYNIKQIQSKINPDTKIMGVVKADCYGHGDGMIARKLQEAGFDWFGVANLEEGISLRNQRIEKPILVLGFTQAQYVDILAKYHITQTLVGMEHAQKLQEEAEKLGVCVDCHVKLDTGMTRVGFQTDDENFEQSLQDIIAVSKMKNLHITGIFTHYAVADAYTNDNPAFTQMQFTRFTQMIDALQKAGVDVGLRHCANSATIISYPEKHLDMCRAGVITYGMLPSDECQGKIDIKPLMTLKTSIGLIKKVKAGSQLSYGRTYTAKTDRIIATVPMGYADGYARVLSNQSRMLVNGKFAPVVGRVCMDQTMLDITDIPDVHMGDEVVVFGRQGDAVLPVEELAEKLHTINYEVTCMVAKRVPRIYMQDGKIVGMVNHLLHIYE